MLTNLCNASVLVQITAEQPCGPACVISLHRTGLPAWQNGKADLVTGVMLSRSRLLACVSLNPGSYSSSWPALRPVSSSTAKPPEAPSLWLMSMRYFFCCLRNCTDSFCSSMASVRCTFCLTCAQPVARVTV